MRFVKDYMKDDDLRHALNELTEATFGFNFESWVINGYFEGDYIPYSYEENGKMLKLHSVISPGPVSLEQVIGEITAEYKTLQLGFTPRQEEADLFEAVVFDGGDDYRLFCRGSRLQSIAREKLYFPTFSHA